MIQFKLKFNQISNSFFQKAALHIAVEHRNVEIVKLLIENDKIDVNLPRVLNKLFSFSL